MTTPFTYVLTHLPSGRRYYGARWANGCLPSDIWTTYFTSSEVIKELVGTDGKDAFSVEVRRTFDTKDACRKWERRVLSRLRVKVNPLWINRAYGAWEDRTGQKHSPASLAKMSASHQRNGKNKGKIRTPEAREKYRLAALKREAVKRSTGYVSPNRGMKRSSESIAKMRAAKLGRKR